MSPRVVLVAGSGSLRSTPPTIASLAAFAPDHEVEVRLWDPNPEKLDLFDRFARACLEVTKLGHTVRSFDNPVEAFEEAEAVIFTMTEGSARRFLAPPPDADPQEEPEPEAPATNVLEFGYGDRNRPTPRSRLSPAIRAILHHPDLTVGREDALRMALERLALLIPEKADVLNLMRGAMVPGGRGIHLDYPDPLTEEQVKAMPHQILRWIQGDAGLSACVEGCRRSPVMRWLISR